MTCSCRKADLHCCSACGECRRVCANVSVDQEDSYIDNETIFFVNSKRRNLHISLVYGQCIITQN